MAFYLKKFGTHSEYEQYINGSGVILPNVSICKTEGDVHYNQSTPVPPTPTDTKIVAKVYVDSEGSAIKLFNYQGGSGSGSGSGGQVPFSSMEIDGVEQPSVVSAYTFSTTGEHTVKYTLADPTSIGESTFYNCVSITSIDIPNSVISIGNYAFSYCYGLTSCTIGSGVTSIGDSAFDGCSSLTSIVSNPTTSPTLVGESVFNGVGDNGVLTVPSGSQGYCDWISNLLSGWAIEGVTC